MRPSSPSTPSPVPRDPLERLGLTGEELDERYALELRLCAEYGDDAARELTEHEKRTAER